LLTILNGWCGASQVAVHCAADGTIASMSTHPHAPLEGTRYLPVQRYPGGPVAVPDQMLDEVPVTLHIDGLALVTLFASPLDLGDFALGYLLTEGLIDKADDLLACDVVDLDRPTADEPARMDRSIRLDLRLAGHCLRRLDAASSPHSAANIVGLRPAAPTVPAVQITPAALQRGMAEMAAGQVLHQATGASHAAGFCRLDGSLLALREDVGAAHALDKLVGWLARSGQSSAEGFVCITSRASYEVVHKATVAGIGLLAAIYAPTALAVLTAETSGLCLLGFVRGERVTLYSRPGGLV
jgi:FdhD protein